MLIKDRHDLSGAELAEHEEKWGRYNDFPPGWREISEAEFAKSQYFIYHPDLIEHRQMLRSKEFEYTGACVDVNLYFYFDGTGYAIVNYFWSGKVRFYTFGQKNPAAYANIDSSD